MRRQQKQMILMLAVLVLLCAGYLGLRKYNQAQSEKKAQGQTEALAPVAADDIVMFSYDYKGTEYTYEKKDGIWYYVEDPDLTLTQERLTQIAETLAQIIPEDTIEQVSDLSQYGLTEPYKVFSFEAASQAYEFYAGDYNEILDTYYICRPGEDTVYTVENYTVTVMNLDVEEIVEEVTEETGETEEIS